MRRAIAAEPSLLVADEPTSALDVTVQAGILDLLLDLQERTGVGMLVITHDLGVVADIGAVAAVMYAGQVVELAPVEELLAAPRHPYSQGLLDAMPEDAVRGEPLPTVAGTVPLPKDWPTHCRFAARCPLAVDAYPQTETETIQPGCSACIVLENIGDTKLLVVVSARVAIGW